MACDLPVRVCGGESWVSGTVENVSMGGMLLKLDPAALPAETVAIQWAEGTTRMKIWASVVRRETATQRLGLAFERMTSETAERLKNCLSSLATAA
jgi:hypothetical protein